MTYLYKCGCVVVEQDFLTGQAPEHIEVGGKRYSRQFVCNPVIPPYMKAPGSSGSSADSCDRQAIYLQSDLHRSHMEESEVNKERNQNLKNSWADCKRDMKKKLEAL